MSHLIIIIVGSNYCTFEEFEELVFEEPLTPTWLWVDSWCPFTTLFLIALIGYSCGAHQVGRSILMLSEKAMIMDASQSCHLHRFPHWTYTATASILHTCALFLGT